MNLTPSPLQTLSLLVASARFGHIRLPELAICLYVESGTLYIQTGRLSVVTDDQAPRLLEAVKAAKSA